MSANSTSVGRRRKAIKRAKPHKDFPLFQHATGRWAKKVRGKFCYFGKVADDLNGQAALELWLEQKDDLLAGRKPRTKSGELTVADLCNRFHAFKKSALDAGELAQRSFDYYYQICDLLVAQFSGGRVVVDLRPIDFEKLRATMSINWGPVRLGNAIQVVRSIFRYGYESDLIDRPIKFGPGFKKPSAKTLRKQRASSGPRMFGRDDLLKVIAVAVPNVKAMTLLAINGGLGNTDLAKLPKSAIDLDGGWLIYARTKTGIARRIPLWPETIKAIKSVLQQQNTPNDPNDAHLLFIGNRGESYVGTSNGYRVHQAFKWALGRAKVKGRTFYDLRRTFQTIAEEAHDLVAVQAIMGHAPASGDMSAIYRQRVDDARLIAVVNHVRAWLFKGAK